MNKNDGIPYYTVRRLLKEYIECEVTSSYVDAIKEIVDSLIKDLAKASIREMDESNELRTLHNLRALKRIDKSMLVKEGILREPTENIIYYIPDVNISYQ